MTGSEQGFNDPELTPDITLVEIDSGRDPLLARLADAIYRWRFGLVVLSPVVIAISAFTIVEQQASPDPTMIEAERPNSAIEPLILGVAGPSSRAGAAPSATTEPRSTPPSTIEVDDSNETDHTVSDAATPQSSSDSSETTVGEPVDGVSTAKPQHPFTPSSTEPPSTTSTPPETGSSSTTSSRLALGSS